MKRKPEPKPDRFALWLAWLPYNTKPWKPNEQHPDENFGSLPRCDW